MTANEDLWLAILAFRNTPTEDMATRPAQRLMSRRTKTLMPMVEHRLFPDSSGQETCRRASTEARETWRVLQQNAKGFARPESGRWNLGKAAHSWTNDMEKSNWCCSTYWTSFFWYSDEHRRNFKTKQNWFQKKALKPTTEKSRTSTRKTMAKMLDSNCNIQEDQKITGTIIQTTKE